MGIRERHQKEIDDLKMQHAVTISEIVAVHEDVLSSMRKTTEHVATKHAEELAFQKKQVFIEQQARAAAQRGLVPYVTAVQALNRWLRDRPEVGKELQPIMKELGLWGVELGYDPDKDKALSVIWAKR